jgi:hypothetical protein
MNFARPITAARLADKLRACELPILRSEEGDEGQDGAVYLTEKISVQVPTYGGLPCVVLESDAGDEWTHMTDRTTLADLVKDCRKALES